MHNNVSLFLQSPDKEPCQRSQTSLEGDQSPDISNPTTPSPTPFPRRGAQSESPPNDHLVSVMGLPGSPSHQIHFQGDSEEVGDRLIDEGVLEVEKSESEASTKTFSTDSGIEDGKTTPTLEDEKVLFIFFFTFLLQVYFKMMINISSSPPPTPQVCFRDSRTH